jgi:hypothetical protein
MKRLSKLERILEQFPDEEILKADGFDDCIIGYDYGGDIRLIYSVKKVLNSLMKKDYMTYEEALEHFDFNIGGAYVGEKTPIWCHDDY